MNFEEYKKKIESIKKHLALQFSSIRISNASVSLLDNVKVQAYGSLMPLNQLASLSSEGPKTLLVSPFDKSLTKEIEKAIQEADLGVSVSVSENSIRLSFPDLTSERRESLLKLAGKKLEEAKISLRQARDEIWSEIQEKQRASEISEDEKYSLKEKMEELTKEAQKEFEVMYKEKEKEIAL